MNSSPVDSHPRRATPGRGLKGADGVALAVMLWAGGVGIHTAQAHDQQWRQAHSWSDTELVFPDTGEVTPYLSEASQASDITISVHEDCTARDCAVAWRLSGTFGSTDDLKKKVENARRRSGDRWPARMALDSLGGAVDPAIWLARVVELEYINTEVDNDGACISACVYVLTAGPQRKVGKWAVVGVHQQSATRSLLPDSIRGLGSQEVETHLNGLPDIPATQVVAGLNRATDLVQRSTGWWVSQTVRTGVSPLIVAYASMAPHDTVLPLPHSCLVALNVDNQTRARPWRPEDTHQYCEQPRTPNR